MPTDGTYEDSDGIFQDSDGEWYDGISPGDRNYKQLLVIMLQEEERWPSP